MLIRPHREGLMHLDCYYVDADLAGGFSTEDPMDPICAKSRTGYVLKLGQTPLVCVSKLQTKTALSTMEAETSALCSAMRDLLPLRALIKEIKAVWTDLPIDELSIVHEDNAACHKFVNGGIVPKLTPRNKHFALETYWFLEQLGTTLKIDKIDTKGQLGDTFTKPLPTEDFVRIRKLLMGW